MKINGKIITGIKINGSEILLGKINGSIVFTKNSDGMMQIILNGKEIIVDGVTTGSYELCYGNSSGALSDYEAISSLSFTGEEWSYTHLNELNVAPPEATKILLVSNGIVQGSVELNDEFKFKTSDYGNKMYSVGLLSDVHIDGNGDGNDSDSGNSQSDFINALQFFVNKNVDLICIDGDVTYYGYDADYTAYNNLVNEYSNNIPVKAIRGNHECYVNGDSNLDYTNTKFQDNIAPLYYEYTKNDDVYLFCGMYQESKSTPFSTDEMTWLATKLEEYKNKRVFLFVHYYCSPVGNVNEISTHGPISNGTFIDLITQYKNIIYFSGHTHLAFKLQVYGSTANIAEKGSICNRVHIPSCAKPRTSMSGLGGSAELYTEGSEGFFMDVYEKGLFLRGINFENNKYLPIATYYLPTSIGETDEMPYTVATTWVAYNTPNDEGPLGRGSLDVWMYNISGDGNLHGLALDFTLTTTLTLNFSVSCYAYAGAPRYFSLYILKNGEIYQEFPQTFDTQGTKFTASIQQSLDAGEYQLVIGAKRSFEMGVVNDKLSFN